jgi:hypothetical protein
METTTVTTTSSNRILLTTREQFPLWYDTIQEYALSYQIWEFCDPDGFLEPTSSLKSDQAEALRKLANRINTTVSADFRVYLLQKHTARSKLQALRQNLQLTEEDLTTQVRADFEALRKGQGRRISTEAYLSKWIHLAHKAKLLNISNLNEQAICDGFIAASTESNPIFFGQMKAKRLALSETAKISSKLIELLTQVVNNQLAATPTTPSSSETQPDGQNTAILNTLDQYKQLTNANLTILDCIALYRETFPYASSIKRTANAAFGASLGSEKLPAEEAEEQPTKRPKKQAKAKKCICDYAHSYLKCWYLNPSAAAEDWKPRDEVVARIVALLNGNTKIKSEIEAIFTSKKLSLPTFWPKQAVNAIHAVYAVCATSLERENSLFKLDSAATLHITNDKNRLLDFRPASEQVLFGNTADSLQGYGDLVLPVRAANGERKHIKISNVAYIPGFHFNIISTQKLETFGLFFEPRRCCLANRAGEPQYRIEHVGSYYTLEDSILQHAAYATRTTQQPIAKASLSL